MPSEKEVMNEAGLLLCNQCKEVMHNNAKLHSYVMTSDMSTMFSVLSIMRTFIFLLLNKSLKVLTSNKLFILSSIKKYACERATCALPELSLYKGSYENTPEDRFSRMYDIVRILS